jgi:acetoin utilization deacetylase AcuC-like enzyme
MKEDGHKEAQKDTKRNPGGFGQCSISRAWFFAPFCASLWPILPMLILHDPQCADYGSSLRPEQPARVTRTAAHLRAAQPGWSWRIPHAPVSEETLLLAHTPAHLTRLAVARDFDDDTPFFAGIGDHARRAVSAAIEAAQHALTTREAVFSLMRPPGHHATAGHSMGFCYLNQIAVAARYAHQHLGAKRVAVWDPDAHHGNGTEAILHAHTSAPARPTTGAFFFASVHQSPGYPGTGTRDLGPFTRNWPITPRTPRALHMAALRESLDAVIAFRPDLILVSAGFDAYARDPITTMTLEPEDFATLGHWLAETRSRHGIPAAAILEGGYSDDLPLLVEAFLATWNNSA